MAGRNPVIDNLLLKPGDMPGIKAKKHAEHAYVTRLWESMNESRKYMHNLSAQSAKLLRKFAGANTPQKPTGHRNDTTWSSADVDNDVTLSRPLNNLYLYGSTLVPLLVMNNPTPSITSDTPELRHIGWGLEQALSELYETINFDDIIRCAVWRSLFGLSVMRCFLADGGNTIMDGETNVDNGQPLIENFGAERFRFDPRATRFEDCRWMGHHYSLPEDYFIESGEFKRTEEVSVNVFPDQALNIDPYERRVALFDCWLPEGNPLSGDPVIVTLSTGGHVPIIHKIADYNGDERGPYEIISLTPIVDSVVPLPPANLWERMDEIINALANKIHNQALRQKDITLYDRATNPDEVTSVLDSNDGAYLPTSDPSRYNQLSFSGVNSELMAALEVFKAQASEAARNIDQLGGAGTTGDPTATEVATLQANANVATEDMIRCVHKPVDRIGHKLMWYVFIDSDLDKRLSARDPAGIARKSRITNDDITGEFLDYNFKHQLYSMQRMTPEKKVSNWMTLLGQVLLPLIPLAQQQGDSINVAEVAGEMAKLLQLPEIDRFFIAYEPPPEQQMGAQVKGGQSQSEQQSTGISPGQQYGRPQPKPAIQTNINAGQSPTPPKRMAAVGQGV